MGYMDISIVSSDMAADCIGNINEIIAQKLRKELKQDNGCYNTDGWVNVALWFEGCVVNSLDGWLELCGNPLYQVAVDCRKLLNEKSIKTAQDKNLWEEEDNRLMHLNRYLELQKALDKFIKRYKKEWGEWEDLD